MEIFKELETDKRFLYSASYFSGNYNQLLYLKRAKDDGSNRPKFYISAFANINGVLTLQGYIYFYIDFNTKKSDFIGIAVKPEYRNLGISSLLISSWIDICLNNEIDYLGTHYKQKKPFLLYLLKTYGFEIDNIKLYRTSDSLISLYRDPDFSNTSKYLLFRSPLHEKAFMKTNIYKSDNYSVLHNTAGFYEIGRVIVPLQNMSIMKVSYELKNEDAAAEKVAKILSMHKKA